MIRMASEDEYLDAVENLSSDSGSLRLSRRQDAPPTNRSNGSAQNDFSRHPSNDAQLPVENEFEMVDTGRIEVVDDGLEDGDRSRNESNGRLAGGDRLVPSIYNRSSAGDREQLYTKNDTMKLDEDSATNLRSKYNVGPPPLNTAGAPLGSPEAEKLLGSDGTPSVLITGTPSSPAGESQPQFRTYKMRWFILAVAALLNFANTVSWIAFAPVANYTDMFYGRHAANWLSMIFLVAAIPVAFVAMWAASRFGIRMAILYAAWANALGACLRMLSSLTMFDQPSRFIIVLVGQCLAASAYPFIMYLPTKVSAAWFPDNQRALASTIGTMANPLGVLIASLVSPQIVHSSHDIYRLNVATLAVCLLVVSMATIGVRRSEPLIPPTKSASQELYPFVKGLIKLMTSRTYWLIFVCLGCGIGMFNCLYTVMQQILCAKGYSNSFSGLCSALMIVGGVAGSICSSIIVDRTRKFEEVMKIGLSGAVLMGIAYAECALYPNLEPAIAIICFIFGFFGVGAYPIGMELSVECTHPVAPTSASGMVVLMGQFQGVLFILMMQTLGGPPDPRDYLIETCSIRAAVQTAPVDGQSDVPKEAQSSVGASDMTLPLLLFAGIAAVLFSFFTAVFRPKYKRLQIEEAAKAGQLAEEKKISREMIENGKKEGAERLGYVNARSNVV